VLVEIVGGQELDLRGAYVLRGRRRNSNFEDDNFEDAIILGNMLLHSVYLARIMMFQSGNGNCTPRSSTENEAAQVCSY
jgi:hypothetical protein